MSISAGELNRRVQVYSKQKFKNELNQVIFDYQPYKKMWVKITPQTNKAMNAQAGTKAAEVTHKIETRYRKDITMEMYIKYGDVRYNIQAPPLDPYASHEFIEMMVSEVAE